MTMSRLYLLFLILTGCARADSQYVSCNTYDRSIQYRSEIGTHLNIIQLPFNETSITFDDEHGSVSDNSRLQFGTGEVGYFSDGYLFIPPDFERRNRWEGHGVSCTKRSRDNNRKILISCTQQDNNEVIDFVFSRSVGVTMIGYHPIITGQERGERYFRLISPVGVAAECR